MPRRRVRVKLPRRRPRPPRRAPARFCAYMLDDGRRKFPVCVTRVELRGARDIPKALQAKALAMGPGGEVRWPTRYLGRPIEYVIRRTR